MGNFTQIKVKYINCIWCIKVKSYQKQVTQKNTDKVVLLSEIKITLELKFT